MTEHIYPRFKGPLTAEEFIGLTGSSIRSGVLTDMLVTPGSTGWKLSPRAGAGWIGGVYLFDDEDHLNLLDLGHTPGQERHYVAYRSYTPSATEVPSSSVIGVAVATPPSQPVLPGNAVKLADIFVPTTATGIGSLATGYLATDLVQRTNQGVTIQNAPRLPLLGDVDRRTELLAQALASTVLFCDGSLFYDDDTHLLKLTENLVIQTMADTNRATFGSAALVRATVTAFPAGVAVPGTDEDRDVLVFAVVDRSVPTLTQSTTIQLLDLEDPDTDVLDMFQDADVACNIVLIGIINGSSLRLTSGFGSLPPQEEDERQFLRNQSSGEHIWDLVDDTDVVGGLRAGLANLAAVQAVPADVRKRGGVFYQQDEDTYLMLKAGVANGDLTRLFDDNRLDGSLRVITWTPSGSDNDETSLNTFLKAQIPAARRKVGMIVNVAESGGLLAVRRMWDGTDFTIETDKLQSGFGILNGCVVTAPSADTIQITAGRFVVPSGRLVRIPVTRTFTVSGSNKVLFWDRTTNELAMDDIATLGANDFPFALASASGSFITKFWSLPYMFSNVQTQDEVVVGTGVSNVNCAHLHIALRWLSCFAASAGMPRKVRMVSDTTPAALTSIGTGNVDISGNVSATGTRFKRDLAVGDLVRIGSINATVTAVTDETHFTCSAWTGGALSTQALRRCDYASQMSPAIDLSLADFTPASLAGLKIVGMPGTSAVPALTWGTSEYAASKQFINMAGTRGFETEKHSYIYEGARDATNHNLCLFKGLGGDSKIKDMASFASSTPGRGLTHWFNISHDSVDIEIDNASLASLNGVGSSAFFISADVSADIRMSGGSIKTLSGDDMDALISVATGIAAHGVNVRIEDAELAGFNVVAFDPRLPKFSTKNLVRCRVGGKVSGGPTRIWSQPSGGTNIASGSNPIVSAPDANGEVTVTNLSGLTDTCEGAVITFASMTSGLNNGTFLVSKFVSSSSVVIAHATGVAGSAAGTWVVEEPLLTDGGRVDLDGCVFSGGDVNLVGTRIAKDCFDDGSISVVIGSETENVNCTFTDITGFGGGMSTAGNLTLQGPTAARTASLSIDTAGALQSAWTPDESLSVVASGLLEVHPAFSGGPVIQILKSQDDGLMMVFPDGDLVEIADGTVELAITGADHDLATGAAALDFTIYYVFARRASAASGGAHDGFVYSSRPPRSNGGLSNSDTPEGADDTLRTANDYAYLGSLMTGDVSTTEPWGGCRVSYLGGGLRRVWAASAGFDGALQTSGSLATTGGAGAGIGSTTMNINAINAALPKAREFDFFVTLTLLGSNATELGARASLVSPSGDSIEVTSPVTLTSTAAQMSANGKLSVPRLNQLTTDYQFKLKHLNDLDCSSTAGVTLMSWLENIAFQTIRNPPRNEGLT